MLFSMFDSWLFSIWDFWLCHFLGPWSTLPPAGGRGEKEQGMQTYLLTTLSWKQHNCFCSNSMERMSHMIPHRFKEKVKHELWYTVSCLFPSPSLWPLNISEYSSSYMLNKLITLLKEVNSELHSVTLSNSKSRKSRVYIIISISYGCDSS